MCSNRQGNLRTADSTGQQLPERRDIWSARPGLVPVRVTVCAAVCHAPLVPSPKNGGRRDKESKVRESKESKFPRRIKDVRPETSDFYTFESLPVSLARWSGNQP